VKGEDTIMPEDGYVEIMSGGGYPLEQVFDAKTGRYFAPIPSDNLREQIKGNYLRHAGTNAARFDTTWPYLWRLTDYTYDGAPLTAIIDSGVLSAHPMLRDCIREVVDFTGEGGEDSVGHGTTVALIWRMVLPGLPHKKLILLKCIGRDGRGRQENLIAALTWMRDYNARSMEKIAEAVMSLGIYNKRLGLFACDGTCPLCSAAVETSKTIRLVVAAGNLAGKTACPACAAFLPTQPNIVAATRPDETTAGKGTVSLTTGYATERVPFFTFQPEKSQAH
jgi:hypothetical protein